ncbi:MAG TPA: ribosome maturation factor RimM [Desulfuromonadaceae bacterium]
MPESDALIPVGKIIGAHGIRGQVRVYSYSGNLESLRAARSVVLKSPQGDTREVAIKGVTPHSGKIILGLKDFTDINQVLPLVGSEVCLWRSQLPEPEEDEYYWRDLIGLEVVTTDGAVIGSVVDIFETGSNDVYVVRSGDREYLIPAIGDVIRSIDLESGRMTITPLEGLLDL